jgi:hypothetical protein
MQPEVQELQLLSLRHECGNMRRINLIATRAHERNGGCWNGQSFMSRSTATTTITIITMMMMMMTTAAVSMVIIIITKGLNVLLPDPLAYRGDGSGGGNCRNKLPSAALLFVYRGYNPQLS